MNRQLSVSITSVLLALAVTLVWTGDAAAWTEYNQGCNNCHGDRKHGDHRSNVSGNCELCHLGGTGPVTLNQSDGGLPGPGPSNLACLGCHGRYDATMTVQGYGLRLHHVNAGTMDCSTCHPNDPPPPPEDTVPPYFVRNDVVPHEPCNSDNSEDYDGSGAGLDNDGDLLYDAIDPDCQVSPCVATAMAAPATLSLCEGEASTLNDDGSTANCAPGDLFVYEWYDGPAGDPGSNLVGTGPSYDLPTDLPVGVHTYDLYVHCQNETDCNDSLDTPIEVEVFAIPFLDCGTSPLSGDVATWIPIGGDAASDGDFFLWSFQSLTGAIMGETTLNGASYQDSAPGTYDVTLTAGLNHVPITCEDECVVQVDVRDGGCAVTPGRIDGLMIIKDPLLAPVDANLNWQLDGDSEFYRVYSLDSVADYASGPPRGSNAAATERCNTPDQATTSCLHTGGLTATPALLLYEVVGVCAGDNSVEGPN